MYNSTRVDHSLYILGEHVQDKIEAMYYNLRIFFFYEVGPHSTSHLIFLHDFFYWVKIAKKFSRELKQKSVDCMSLIVL